MADITLDEKQSAILRDKSRKLTDLVLEDGVELTGRNANKYIGSNARTQKLQAMTNELNEVAATMRDVYKQHGLTQQEKDNFQKLDQIYSNMKRNGTLPRELEEQAKIAKEIAGFDVMREPGSRIRLNDGTDVSMPARQQGASDSKQQSASTTDERKQALVAKAEDMLKKIEERSKKPGKPDDKEIAELLKMVIALLTGKETDAKAAEQEKGKSQGPASGTATPNTPEEMSKAIAAWGKDALGLKDDALAKFEKKWQDEYKDLSPEGRAAMIDRWQKDREAALKLKETVTKGLSGSEADNAWQKYIESLARDGQSGQDRFTLMHYSEIDELNKQQQRHAQPQLTPEQQSKIRFADANEALEQAAQEQARAELGPNANQEDLKKRSAELLNAAREEHNLNAPVIGPEDRNAKTERTQNATKGMKENTEALNQLRAAETQLAMLERADSSQVKERGQKAVDEAAANIKAAGEAGKMHVEGQTANIQERITALQNLEAKTRAYAQEVAKAGKLGLSDEELKARGIEKGSEEEKAATVDKYVNRVMAAQKDRTVDQINDLSKLAEKKTGEAAKLAETAETLQKAAQIKAEDNGKEFGDSLKEAGNKAKALDLKGAGESLQRGFKVAGVSFSLNADAASKLDKIKNEFEDFLKEANADIGKPGIAKPGQGIGGMPKSHGRG